jgi:mRNA-degrading endonuclease toxin of MazEF toxin-antitoxin module
LSAPLEDLQRGSLCLALYPFTPELPLEVVLREAGDINAKLESYDSIEAVARIERRELVVEFKIRPVLLLQTGTSNQLADVLVSRVNSITEQQRQQRQNWVRKLESGIHPVMLRVGHQEHHGLKAESYVNLLSVQQVNKAAILRRLGHLTDEEMVEVSERLVRTLEIDVSAYVARLRPGATQASASESESPD